MEEIKLHIIEGHEKFIEKLLLGVDVNYFDLDSLIRLYGRQTVLNFIRGSLSLEYKHD